MLVYQISLAGFELFFMTFSCVNTFFCFGKSQSCLYVVEDFPQEKTLIITFLSNAWVGLFKTQMLYRRLRTDLELTSILNCRSNIT